MLMSSPTKVDLKMKYQSKGAQKTTYKDYLTQQEKSSKKQFKMPPFVKYILMIPFILIFCFGLIFIPYLIFKALTSPSADSKTHAELSKKTSS